MPGLIPIESGLQPDSLPYCIKAFGASSKFGTGLGNPVTLNYSLKIDGQNPYGQSYRALSSDEITNIEQSLASLAMHSGLSFNLTDQAEADLLIGASFDVETDAYGRTWMHPSQAVEVIAYDSLYSNPSELANNSYNYP
jgi:hypothetical protein